MQKEKEKSLITVSQSKAAAANCKQMAKLFFCCPPPPFSNVRFVYTQKSLRLIAVYNYL